MPNLHRYRMDLGGWAGAPGVNTIFIRFEAVPFIEDAQAVADLINAAYYSLTLYFVQGMTMQLNPEVAIIDSATGQLQDAVAITPGNAMIGQGDGAVSRAQMMLARLNTNKVIDGHRVRGRLFLGPSSANAMDANGQLLSGVQQDIASAFNGLIGSAGEGRLVVWHRPSQAGAADGDFGEVTAVTAKPVPAVLRSRRD